MHLHVFGGKVYLINYHIRRKFESCLFYDIGAELA